MDGTSRPGATEILNYVEARRNEFIDLLKRMTLEESPSVVPEAQHGIRAVIAAEFARRDMRVRSLAGKSSGGMLLAAPGRRVRGRPLQLILGHYDTVWPLGTLDNMPFEIDGDCVRGPGVYDMKGGIAQTLIAIDALQHFMTDIAVTPVFFANSDEEIGSRDSGRWIHSLARRMNRVFVLEPSLGPAGRLKTARKGIGRFTVVVEGRAAHAGLDPGGGASAILELSHVIQALFALNDHKRGITVNVGTIDGGLRPNVIAPESRAVADVRVETLVDAERVEEAILGLRATTPGTRLAIEGGFGRPALERTEANRGLWDLAVDLGRELGIELQQGLAGGGSDGNTTSLYTATLDGLGAVGDGAHAPHEHLLVGPTLERAALLAMLLMADPLEAREIQRTGVA
jgi:glutamate carboxypeptidase